MTTSISKINVTFYSHPKESNDPQLTIQSGYNRVDNEAVKGGGLVKKLERPQVRLYVNQKVYFIIF